MSSGRAANRRLRAYWTKGWISTDWKSGKNFLPLKEAAERKEDGQEIFHLLVSRGADLELTTPYGKSILDTAIGPNRNWLLEHLLGNLNFESLLSQSGIRKSRCLTYCLSRKRYDLFWLLKDKGFEVTQEKYERLVSEACAHAQDKPGEEILSHLLGPDYRDIRGNLHRVIHKLNWPLLRTYLRDGKIGHEDISVNSAILSLLRYESSLDDYAEIAQEFKFNEAEGRDACSNAMTSVLSLLLKSTNCPKLCYGMHLTKDERNKPTCSEHTEFLRSIFDWHKERFPIKDASFNNPTQEKLLETLVRYEEAHELLSELLGAGLDPPQYHRVSEHLLSA